MPARDPGIGERRHALRPLLLISLVALACTACATREEASLPLQSAPPFSESGPAALPQRWWRAFDDPGLNAQVAQALAGSFTLASAWQRLQAARALARRTSSELYPDLDLGASGQWQDADAGPAPDTFEAGPAASYEVDLWGRIGSLAEAERLRARASEADYRTAALSLAADVALTWYRLVEARLQRALLNRQIATNQKVLKVLNARFDAGQVRSEDILRQRLAIAAIREDVIALEAQVAALEHQLAILQGEAPQGKRFTVAEHLPALAPRPAAGLPADLVRRRPDVRAAFYRLAAADSELAAAIRDRYPRLNLSASYVSQATAPADLFTTWLATLGGTLIAPVLDGGQRQAEIERSEALRAQRVADYAQAVLAAFGEVEDALIRERTQRERISNLAGRLAIARDTYAQVQIGYLNGVNDYLDALSAQVQLQQIERDLLAARRGLVELRIALYRALAGGFETPGEAAATDDAGGAPQG